MALVEISARIFWKFRIYSLLQSAILSVERMILAYRYRSGDHHDEGIPVEASVKLRRLVRVFPQVEVTRWR